jgi:hypothetical protein
MFWNFISLLCVHITIIYADFFSGQKFFGINVEHRLSNISFMRNIDMRTSLINLYFQIKRTFGHKFLFSLFNIFSYS